MTRITLRDLRVGQVFETGSTVIERAAIMAFAAAYDPQPMHLEDAAAEASLFGQLIASGWHVAALTMRLMVEARPFGAATCQPLAINCPNSEASAAASSRCIGCGS